MYSLPQWALDVVRGPHRQYGLLTARRNGTILSRTGDPWVIGDDPTLLPLDGGDVKVDGTQAGPRRTLSVNLAPEEDLWDLLSPIGTELLPYSVIESPAGVSVTIPQGVFAVDVLSMGYGPSGDVQITCPDRWDQVVNDKFLVPRQFGGQSVRSLIAQLITEAVPGVFVTDLGTSTATVPVQTVDEDRAQFIQQLCQAAALDVFFDRSGNAVIRDVPTLSYSSQWLVDASVSGVLLKANRQRNRQNTRNVVVVTSQIADGSTPFDPVIVWDSDPASPTYAGTDPLNHPETAGPMGIRPTRYSSPLITDGGAAAVAGQGILEKVRGLNAQLTVEIAPMPALDDGDTIEVVLPPGRSYQVGGSSGITALGRSAPFTTEYHLADAFNIPLRPSKQSTQQIATRSTHADTASG